VESGDLQLSTLKNKIGSLLPQGWVGAIEYHLNPRRLDGFGGAFNGQCFRQLIFWDLARSCRFEAIVETGTYVGCTTLFLASNCNLPVYSAEISARWLGIAKRRLAAYSNVKFTKADSVAFLSSLPLSQETRIFFYLDAHWLDHLPLRDEIEVIFNKFRNFVVMIDDFRVPSDDGYTYDDYGPGKQLSLRDFPLHMDRRVSAYFPGRPASEESGYRRGCIILASTTMKVAADSLDCLKPATVETSSPL
jgi:hypothetical protein